MNTEWTIDPITGEQRKTAFLPVSQIHPDKYNPRVLKPQHLAELKPSIATNGVLVPLVVVENADGYATLGGEHRLNVLAALAEEKGQPDMLVPVTIYSKNLPLNRRFAIAQELNEGQKSTNYGEDARHIVKIRNATEGWLTERGEPDPSEHQLARAAGYDKPASKRKLFVQGPQIAEIRSKSSLARWITDAQVPAGSIWSGEQEGGLTAQNLAIHLEPFVNLSLLDDGEPNLREQEMQNVLKYCDLMAEHLFLPLWDKIVKKRSSSGEVKRHQNMLEMTLRHPFQALGRVLASDPDTFTTEGNFYTDDDKAIDWSRLEERLNAAATIDWGKEKLAKERSTGTLVGSLTYELNRAVQKA